MICSVNPSKFFWSASRTEGWGGVRKLPASAVFSSGQVSHFGTTCSKSRTTSASLCRSFSLLTYYFLSPIILGSLSWCSKLTVIYVIKGVSIVSDLKIQIHLLHHHDCWNSNDVPSLPGKIYSSFSTQAFTWKNNSWRWINAIIWILPRTKLNKFKSLTPFSIYWLSHTPKYFLCEA